MPTKTLFIVNPYARSGKAMQLWNNLALLVMEHFEDISVAITSDPHDVMKQLDAARVAKIEQVIAVGGDGTNHEVVNNLMRLKLAYPDDPLPAFGQLPLGTGQDFVRILEMPDTTKAAIQWLAKSKARPIDIGIAEYGGRTTYFLNVASACITGTIVKNIDMQTKRYPWTFWLQTIKTILKYTPTPLKIYLDGDLWYEGKSWIVAVANGGYFGRGMHVAPESKLDDGLFDVLAAENLPRFTALRAFSTIYSGKHIERDDVLMQRAKEVHITFDDGMSPLELDGEYAQAQDITFRILPKALSVLQMP